MIAVEPTKQIRKVRNTGALGLPSGSVRAILTLMTVGFITIQTARGKHVGLLWFESLMIVLAHYFASRRLVQMPRELRERLQAEGVIENEPNPLYLPRYSLRVFIIGAFVGLAVYLWQNGRLFDPVAVPIFIAVGAYFLGIMFHAFMGWWKRGKPKPEGTTWIDDAKAIVTVGAMALVIVLQLLGWQQHIPYGEKLEALPLALMLFYFGSR